MSRPTFLSFDLINTISSNMYLQPVYESSMSSNKPFACHDLPIWVTKCIKFMIRYILQYEIPLQVKFSNLGHDLLFWVMTSLTSYHPICTENLYPSGQCQVMSLACHNLLIWLAKCIKFMITYVLQYEIPLRMQFSNLCQDLLFWVLT